MFRKHKLLREQTYYDILEISQTATAKEITSAYRKKMLKEHPDHNPGRIAEATLNTAEIIEAYEILGNDITRKEYDAELPELLEIRTWKKPKNASSPKEQKHTYHPKNKPEDTLLQAAHYGDLVTVQKIIRQNAQLIDYQNKEGRTALINAAWNNNTAIVEFLIREGAKLNIKIHEGTAVHCAASYGWHEPLKVLLEHKAEVDALSRRGKTALAKVVSETDMDARAPKFLKCAQLLIQYHATINFQDEDGYSILQNTADNTIFSYLIEQKADINLANPKNNITPLLYFCKKLNKSNLIKIQMLINSGANINAVTHSGRSALDLLFNSDAEENLKEQAIAFLFSAENQKFDNCLKTRAINAVLKTKSKETLPLLLKLGMALPIPPLNEYILQLYNAKKFEELIKILDTSTPLKSDDSKPILDENGNTVLMRAINDEQYKIAFKLIPFSMLNIRNKNDQSPLGLAARSCNAELVKAILDSGANANELDKDGMPLLSHYIKRDSGRGKIATVLIDYADLSYVNNNGDTYLIEAIKTNACKLARVILNRHPHNVNAKNKKGSTALSIAVHEGNNNDARDYVDIIEQLLKVGADPFIVAPGSWIWSNTPYELGIDNYAFGYLFKALKKPAEEKSTASNKTIPTVVVSSVPASFYSSKDQEMTDAIQQNVKENPSYTHK